MEAVKELSGLLPDGSEVWLYTLCAGDLSLRLSDLGAALVGLRVPSREHGSDDILLGCRGFEGALSNRNYFGVTVGRFANRVSGPSFRLDGREYRLSENKPGCSLHGGREGFSRRLWRGEPYRDGEGVFVRFTLESPDGDQGYPGALRAAVSYGLSPDNRLIARYEAEVDAPCPVNLTNHSYFNLAGHSRGRSILSTQVRLRCSAYVEVDGALKPTGRVLPVEGTPLDFRAEKALGRDIGPLLDGGPGGYDHCLAVDGRPGELRLFGEFRDPMTGRRMKGYTTQPGLQLYTGNMLASAPGKEGAVYERHAGFCIEPEYFPDSPNQPGFPSALFGPGRNYSEKAVLAFDW